jgi:hypothetical protein
MPADPLTAARRAWNEDRWADTVRHAVRSAFWLAFANIDRLDLQSLAGGWLSRARRLLADCEDDCVEQGLLPCAQAYHDVVRGVFGGARLLGNLAAAETAFHQVARAGRSVYGGRGSENGPYVASRPR